MDRLSGKVAVITGGTRGLGLALAQAYLAEGARVMIGSRSKEAVENAVSRLREKGYDVHGAVVDVGDLAQVQALKDQTLIKFNSLDIWLNNAGCAAPYGPTLGVDPTTIHQVVQTNILGVYYGS